MAERDPSQQTGPGQRGQDVKQPPQAELSDDQLDQVAGGKVNFDDSVQDGTSNTRLG